MQNININDYLEKIYKYFRNKKGRLAENYVFLLSCNARNYTSMHRIADEIRPFHYMKITGMRGIVNVVP